MAADATARTEHELFGLQPILPVRNVAASVAWYRDVLGFDLDFMYGDPPAHARVSGGGPAEHGPIPVRIQLSQPSRYDDRPLGRAHLMIHVGVDVDGLYHEYAARGVEVVMEPTSQPWGLREFTIADPDGHLLRFAGFLDDARSVPSAAVE